MNKDFLEECRFDKKLTDILNINEINRLHRAAKNKDKKEIAKWADQYDQYVNDKYYEIYRKEYMNWLYHTFKDLDVALCYTLHFSEATKFGQKRIKSFMDDINIIMKGFYRKDFSQKDYLEMLEKDNIHILDDWEEKEKEEE